MSLVGHLLRPGRDVRACCRAHFLAALQVLVYAGAIIVLFVFVIMVLNRDEAEPLRAWSRRLRQGIMASSPLRLPRCPSSAGRWIAVAAARTEARTRRRVRHRRAASASVLFTDYLFAFEADLGAAVGRRRRCGRRGRAPARRGDTEAERRAAADHELASSARRVAQPRHGHEEHH